MTAAGRIGREDRRSHWAGRLANARKVCYQRYVRLELRLALCLTACFAFTAVPSASAQEAEATHPPIPRLKPKPVDLDPGDVISVNTTEVLLPVTVRDNTGQLVPGLTRESFRVFEDGNQQPLGWLFAGCLLMSCFLVDASSSVSENLDDFAEPGKALLPILHLTTGLV